MRKESCWALCNCTSGGSPAQIDELVRRGALAPLCDVLGSGDPKLTPVVLDALANVLRARAASAAPLVVACGGDAAIRRLIERADSPRVVEKACAIVEAHFGPGRAARAPEPADRAVGEGDRGDEAAGDDATVGSSHSSAALPLAHDDPDPPGFDRRPA